MDGGSGRAVKDSVLQGLREEVVSQQGGQNLLHVLLPLVVERVLVRLHLFGHVQVPGSRLQWSE